MAVVTSCLINNPFVFCLKYGQTQCSITMSVEILKINNFFHFYSHIYTNQWWSYGVKIGTFECPATKLWIRKKENEICWISFWYSDLGCWVKLFPWKRRWEIGKQRRDFWLILLIWYNGALSYIINVNRSTNSREWTSIL